MAGGADLDRELQAAKPEQLRRFGELAGRFAARYAVARESFSPELVEDEWQERNEALERSLLPEPPLEFIRHPSVLYSMFVGDRYVEPELPLLRESFGAAELAALLQEDPVGGPPLRPGHDGGPPTSSNTIHHLHHLRRFELETGSAIRDAHVVVEWGGGYGNLAKVARRLHGGRPTYVIVDTPLFTALQWLYLAAVLGEEEVALTGADGEVRPGKVNLVSVGLAGRLDVTADLFISTWALNESPPALQAAVADAAWFSAPHLLMGMHRGVALADRAVADGARVVDVGAWMPGQSYVVR